MEQAPKGIEKVTEGLLPGPAQGRASLEFMSRCMRRTPVGEGVVLVDDGVVGSSLVGDGVAWAGNDRLAMRASELTKVVTWPA